MCSKSFIYIHIPFCLKKCNYCDFCSFPVGTYSIDKYSQILRKEIAFKVSEYQIDNIQTIYIGGGTPGLLSLKQLEDILSFRSTLKIENNAEITIEVNPASVDNSYFKNVYNLGINRISMGVQSLDDKLLKILGRPHTSKEVYLNLDNIKDAGFKNISIDLMYGLPEQTIKQWEKTLNECVKFEIQHISAYGLKIEPETPFSKIYTENHEDIPSDDICEKMFLLTDKILTDNKFEHYEISNYAKDRLFSQHNMNYWQNNDYYGFGLSAHSFIGGKRCENISIMPEYLANYKNYKQVHTPDYRELIEDEIFLKLRTSAGINFESFYNKHKIVFTDKYKHLLVKYKNYFIICEDKVRLNLSGMLLSNLILAEFLEI